MKVEVDFYRKVKIALSALMLNEKDGIRHGLVGQRSNSVDVLVLFPVYY